MRKVSVRSVVRPFGKPIKLDTPIRVPYRREYNHPNISGAKIKPLLSIVGLLLILAGGVFFLQGINVLPGSFMTGDPQWAINGTVMVIVGLGLIFWQSRRK